MRAPLSWIREFTPLEGIGVEAIADALNQLGLEVEGIDEPGRDVNGVVAARILDVVPHPDADRIRLADVDFGDGHVRVVCGAPNIEAGMVVPFARVGAVLPGDFKIERRTIRGVVSEGMLCSARELGLGDDHDGILSLPDNAPLGTDVREILGLDDAVFDLSITPNRPDAMGIVGVARELAAHFGSPFSVDEREPAPLFDEVAGARVIVEAPDRCPRFVALAARVVMGESPAWLQRRLVLAGMRPISNVVDVTNYVMLERCRPLHAYDLAKLPGRGIVVRLAADGEKMTTLDGVERTLSSADLLICDGERRPQGIAGIMGGAEAEVSDTTTEILLESAYFEPSGIALTSKRLGLRSEASARFERGVDPNNAGTGADRAMELLVEVAGAVPAAGAIDVYPEPIERKRITIRTERVNALLGTSLSRDEIAAYLTPLDITLDGPVDELGATVPTFRPDLEREIDLIEEVARRVGLDSIARTVPSSAAKIGGLSSRQRDRRAVGDVLVGAGYDEVYTLPLLAPADLTNVGLETDGLIEVENPLRAEESILRPALLPGLLRSVAYNVAHGAPDVALFESGTVFGLPRPGESLPAERHSVAFARAHHARRAPHEPDRDVDVYDATAALDALAQELRITDIRLDAVAVPGFHPTRAARVVVDGRAVGAIGEVAATVVDALSLAGPVVACEIDVDALLESARTDRMSSPVSRFPASTVDLAFVVDDRIPAAALQKTLAAAGGELVENVALFDVFRSDALGPGKVSLAFSLRFRAVDRTLTDDEVSALRKKCIDAVVAAHGAELRS
ncbi:MAG: phenylalanyl-tRNA synthetase beta subunit [Actinomycetia bacterium]|nr:phenylalanyl-tRNA synthetase beta subunit [Actinomycetes bacterium]